MRNITTSYRKGSTRPTGRTPADDAAYHRREVIRHTRRAQRLTGTAAEAERAQAQVHSLLVAIAEAGEPIPDYVRDNLPTMFVWPEPVE